MTGLTCVPLQFHVNVIYFFNKSHSHKQVPADVMKELVCVSEQFVAGQLSVCVNFVAMCRIKPNCSTNK